MASGSKRWAAMKPKCKGCIYVGHDVPCDYFFVTGKTLRSQGVTIDPNGEGGCALYDNGEKKASPKKNKGNVRKKEAA